MSSITVQITNKRTVSITRNNDTPQIQAGNAMQSPSSLQQAAQPRFYESKSLPLCHVDLEMKKLSQEAVPIADSYSAAPVRSIFSEKELMPEIAKSWAACTGPPMGVRRSSFRTEPLKDCELVHGTDSRSDCSRTPATRKWIFSSGVLLNTHSGDVAPTATAARPPPSSLEVDGSRFPAIRVPPPSHKLLSAVKCSKNYTPAENELFDQLHLSAGEKQMVHVADNAVNLPDLVSQCLNYSTEVQVDSVDRLAPITPVMAESDEELSQVTSTEPEATTRTPENCSPEEKPHEGDTETLEMGDEEDTVHYSMQVNVPRTPPSSLDDAMTSPSSTCVGTPSHCDSEPRPQRKEGEEPHSLPKEKKSYDKGSQTKPASKHSVPFKRQATHATHATPVGVRRPFITGPCSWPQKRLGGNYCDVAVVKSRELSHRSSEEYCMESEGRPPSRHGSTASLHVETYPTGCLDSEAGDKESTQAVQEYYTEDVYVAETAEIEGNTSPDILVIDSPVPTEVDAVVHEDDEKHVDETFPCPAGQWSTFLDERPVMSLEPLLPTVPFDRPVYQSRNAKWAARGQKQKTPRVQGSTPRSCTVSTPRAADVSLAGSADRLSPPEGGRSLRAQKAGVGQKPTSLASVARSATRKSRGNSQPVAMSQQRFLFRPRLYEPPAQLNPRMVSPPKGSVKQHADSHQCQSASEGAAGR